MIQIKLCVSVHDYMLYRDDGFCLTDKNTQDECKLFGFTYVKNLSQKIRYIDLRR